MSRLQIIELTLSPESNLSRVVQIVRELSRAFMHACLEQAPLVVPIQILSTVLQLP